MPATNAKQMLMAAVVTFHSNLHQAKLHLSGNQQLEPRAMTDVQQPNVTDGISLIKSMKCHGEDLQ